MWFVESYVLYNYGRRLIVQNRLFIDQIPTGYKLVWHVSEQWALNYLQSLSKDVVNLATLRSLAYRHHSGAPALATSNAAVIEFVARLWSQGELCLFAEPEPQLLAISDEKKEVDQQNETETSKPDHTFSLTIVDHDSAEALANITVLLRLPGDQEAGEKTTDSEGNIQVNGLAKGHAELFLGSPRWQYCF
ncbi:MAG: hypothetical protein JW841_06320 [Deltaproteobacteria bacterium]|nr:hypothetical protein [Deltaproteobacteria bacterium]